MTGRDPDTPPARPEPEPAFVTWAGIELRNKAQRNGLCLDQALRGAGPHHEPDHSPQPNREAEP